MSQGSPLAVSSTWDLVAPAYAVEVVPIFEEFAHAALRLAAPPSGGRVVDVACGPGTVAVLAATAGHRVDALDFSPTMIARLTERVAERALPIDARVGDGQALPYPDATFHAGFSMFGLMFFPDRAKGFAELRRVLVPGGKAVVSSWHPLDKIPLFTAMMGAVREGMGAPPPAQAGGPLTTAEECRAEMAAAFADVEVHEVAAIQRADSVDVLWESMTRTMAPVVLAKRGLGDRWPAVDAAARAAMRGVAGAGPVEVRLAAHLAVGTAR